MLASPEVLAARKLNLTKYALQDFDEAVTDFGKTAYLLGTLALVMGLSIVFGAENEKYLLLSLVTTVGLLIAVPRLEFLKSGNLIILSFIYIGILVFEIVAFGLPDILVPALNANEWSGAPVFINELVPYKYYGVKIVALFYLINIWYQRSKVAIRPVEDLRKVAPERYQALGVV